MTGKAAYDGDTLMAKLLAHREMPIPSLRAVRPDIPESVDSVFRRMTAKRVDDRYQTMAEVIADLGQGNSHIGPASSTPPSVGPVSDTGLTNFLDEIAVSESPTAMTKRPAPSRDWLRNKKLLAIAGGALGAVVLLTTVVILLQTKAGTPVVDSKKPPGDRPGRNESLRKASKKRNISRKEDEGPTTGSTFSSNVLALSPDREAATFVLSIGGQVVVNYDYARRIKAVSELPKETFYLANVWLAENQKVTDGDLPKFKICNGLWLIDLCGTRVTDAGLAHIKEYGVVHDLSELYLGNTRYTDARGCAHLADCTGVRQLWIFNTGVTDAGFCSTSKE